MYHIPYIISKHRLCRLAYLFWFDHEHPSNHCPAMVHIIIVNKSPNRFETKLKGNKTVLDSYSKSVVPLDVPSPKVKNACFEVMKLMLPLLLTTIY